MIQIIGVGLYGYMSGYGSGEDVSQGIPGRFKVTSEDIRADHSENGSQKPDAWFDCLTSEQELYGTFQADGLLIQYAGKAIFELEKVRIGG